jgi:hypothetical protein
MKSSSYHIFWINETTREQGEGTTSFSKEECKRLCDKANRDFPHITHLAIENE